MVDSIEKFVFRFKAVILGLLAVFTVWMGVYSTQLKTEAGFWKQVPQEHEYIKTFFQYEKDLPGANQIMIVVAAPDGEIWTPEFLKRLYDVTQTVFFLPGVDRSSVTSLWTPNMRVLEVDEEGLRAYDVIAGNVTPDKLTEEQVAVIRKNTVIGGYVGRMVARDFSAALIRAELMEINPETREKLDYLDLSAKMEREVREAYTDEKAEIHIIGFAKMIGEIADRAGDVVIFFGVAFLLTTAAVYIYSKSWVLTFLAVFCSFVSVIWMFGLLVIFGFSLDPLAILVPFLIYAIGVSHGVQQINLISAKTCEGAAPDEAARATFSRLLVPGSMALITDLVGFAILIFIPIGMIQELAIMASLGVALKIITNLLMLPLLATYFKFDDGYVGRVTRARESRIVMTRKLAQIARPRNAIVTFVISLALVGTAVYESRDRKVGDLQAGSPELWPTSLYNQDTAVLVEHFDINVEALVVVVETPSEACIKYEYMSLVDDFGWTMRNLEGVQSVVALSDIAKFNFVIMNESNLAWREMPRNKFNLIQATQAVSTRTGLLNGNCTLLPVVIYTKDHKAETINRIIDAVADFTATRDLGEANFRLAMGSVGIMAATNQVIAASELPMLGYVFLVIIILVFAAYRDWRAVICCCLPLVMATFLGYWFMELMQIGLKVSTLPVLVLAVGIGVDYAFYIYSRLQIYLDQGVDIIEAYGKTLEETGMAVVFTAITLAVGVSTWGFSGLKFQADMGLLLTFMFVANMVGAVTALPALAVILERIFPRKI